MPLSKPKKFQKASGVTGVIVTKLDSTAKGGMVFSIFNDLKLASSLSRLGRTHGRSGAVHARVLRRQPLFDEENEDSRLILKSAQNSKHQAGQATARQARPRGQEARFVIDYERDLRRALACGYEIDFILHCPGAGRCGLCRPPNVEASTKSRRN